MEEEVRSRGGEGEIGMNINMDGITAINSMSVSYDRLGLQEQFTFTFYSFKFLLSWAISIW